MKIVVTGALGHIGSRLIRELPLSFPGAEIAMIDNMAVQRYPSLFNLPEGVNYSFVEGDVMEHDLHSFFKGADVVIHLAAITNAAGSFDIRERVEKENYECTLRVAKACLDVGASMLHLSSTSVYGTQKDIVDENCTEEELKPQSPYAETKIREEKLLRRMFDEDGLKSVVCRFGTIFGISPGMRFHTAVNKFCWQAVLGQPITVWTSAYDQKRPYLDLKDGVRAIRHILEQDLFNGEIYNVLTHNLTVRNVVDTIQESIPGLEIGFVDHSIMNQLSYNVACEKFAATGFRPEGDIRTGIRETLDLLRNANAITRG
jgi:Nucleoside-diphosphate-sugar epimerases